MASSATHEARASPSSATRSLSFTDLPQEVQTEIISHCSTSDLICVSLVSKHFRDLAAAELYRDFFIDFPDEDNPQFDTPIDALAGGFHTFVTSDYDYAQYLRTLSFDTLYLGDKAEVAYRPYLANLSCGKFMNTLLLLTLRRARALESFKWNIRVELSRPVYKELHQIPALSHLHIRLQAGPSQYETPPPLPYSPSHSPPPSIPVHITPIAAIPPPPTFGMIPPPPAQAFYVPSSSIPLPPLPKPFRPKATKKASAAKEPPTLSGFKRLKSLAVLDIEDLDIVPELQSCVRNSAGTLSKLKLSFSEKLASTARKPSVDPDPEDSDPDDELMPLPGGSHSHGQNDEMSGPARIFRAQEEKKIQEAVLGRIFDVESAPAEKAKVVVAEKKEKKGKIKSDGELVDFLKTVASKFMGALSGTGEDAASQEFKDMIGVAAQKYLDEAKARKEKGEESSSSSSASSSSAAKSLDDKTEAAPAETGGAASSLFSDAPRSNKAKEGPRDTSPDDINIEEPEEQLVIEPEDPPTSDGSAGEPTGAAPEDTSSPTTALANTKAEYGKALATLEAQKAEYKALAGELGMFESQANALARDIRRWQANNSATIDFKNLAEAELRLQSFTRSVQDMQKEVSACEAAIEHQQHDADTLPGGGKGAATGKAYHQAGAGAATTRQMRDYLRETRGVALQSLGIYLIPVRASVLSRAIDLRSLRRLTLLNVGIQAPIWALLHRENREAPLPLRKIYSDNVSPVLLGLVAALPEVHELFLLEREAKHKPESFAPRTQVTIDQIRRMVLKRHLGTMRRLMIKNLADTAWDVNEKLVLLLCRQGRKLEELACNLSIRAMHCLMQHVAGLAALRALHVVHLRNEDTCVWVMRETKRFLIDNVSHHPDLPLEWIAIDEDHHADRLMRVKPDREKKGKGKKSGNDDEDGDGGSVAAGAGKDGKGKDKKGKGKQTSSSSPSSLANVLGSLNLASSSSAAAAADDLDVSGIIAAELEGGGSEDLGGGGAPGGGSEVDGDAETDDDESGGEDGFLGQKIETVEGIPFCDVLDVRIFKKEVVAGRL